MHVIIVYRFVDELKVYFDGLRCRERSCSKFTRTKVYGVRDSIIVSYCFLFPSVKPQSVGVQMIDSHEPTYESVILEECMIYWNPFYPYCNR